MSAKAWMPLGACSLATKLLSVEQELRSRAKSTSDFRTAAVLADQAIEVQLKRHQHLSQCALCEAEAVRAARRGSDRGL